MKTFLLLIAMLVSNLVSAGSLTHDCIKSINQPYFNQMVACEDINSEAALKCVQSLKEPNVGLISACAHINSEASLKCVESLKRPYVGLVMMCARN
jgi:hypothetical protein